jgi:site-specific recombinase XerD
MTNEIVRFEEGLALSVKAVEPPAIVLAAGANARFAYDEFFGAEIENDHTRRAYRKAVHRFLAHCDARGINLREISPAVVGEYIRTLQTESRVDKHGVVIRPAKAASKPMKKLHLAGIRHFFDKLVVRHAVALNPALSVRGPKLKVVEGKTMALSVKQARELLGSIDTGGVVGLRDRAVVAVMMYTAARVGAVAKLRGVDYYTDGTQWVFRFDEKGGKVRDIPCRHDVEGYLREYMEAVGDIGDDAPLFRTADRRTKALTKNGMTANDILRMVKRRFKEAGLPARQLVCHSFRATTITDLLEQGVSLEDAQYLAGHADPRTTRLYDRRKRQVTRNIVERISI